MIILEVNQIYDDDCLCLMEQIQSKSIDMIFCDPPFGLTQWEDDIILPFDRLWEIYNRIIKDNGAIVLFGSEPFTSQLICSNIKYFKYNWIWQKNKCTGFLNAKKQPLNDNETLSVFYKKQCTYNPQMTKADKVYSRGYVVRDKELDLQQSENYGEQKSFNQIDNGLRYPKRIQFFDNDFTRKQIHPTQKPIELCRYMIRTYTNKDEIVLDNCCGSGTIPLAAYMEDRKYIGIDNGVCKRKKSKYYGWKWADVSKDRIKEYTEKQLKVMLENVGPV